MCVEEVETPFDVVGRSQPRRIIMLRTRKQRIVAAAVVVAGGVGGATAYLATREAARKNMRMKRKDLSEDNPTNQRGSGRKPSTTSQMKRVLKLLLRIGGPRITTMMILAVLRTALNNRLAHLQGELFRSAFLRKTPVFLQQMAQNVALCLLSSTIESTMRSWITSLGLFWRKHLTGSIHKGYFQQLCFYRLSYVDRSVENPEQRICEDVPKLSVGLSELTGEFLIALVDAAFFTWKLGAYARTHKYTLVMLGYIVGTGVMTGLISPPFGRLFKKEQMLEGTYRHLQARLRANAESIAFYAGVDKESIIIRRKFRELVRHGTMLIKQQWGFGIVQDFLLKYLGATVAVVLIIGPFFRGHLRPENTVNGRAEMLSNMRYHTSVVLSLFNAFGTIALSSRKLMKLSAYASRYCELADKVKELNELPAKKVVDIEGSDQAVQETEESESIVFENVTIRTPTGNNLVEGLTLQVNPGTNLLVTGPNGAGKSSLFRVLGGLWPLVQGRLQKPGAKEHAEGLSHEIFYVPQRPYVTLGTLREQLIYPLTAKEAGDDILPLSELEKLLEMVDLLDLLERDPTGDNPDINWAEELSMGEQQRLGMARLFFHKPAYAILDECTSGVTIDMEERFCDIVRDLGCTCVTISHRPALVAFHDIVLALDGEGGYNIHTGQRGLESGDGKCFADKAKATKVRQSEAKYVEDAFLSSARKSCMGTRTMSVEKHLGRCLGHSPDTEVTSTSTVIKRMQSVQSIESVQEWHKSLQVALSPGYSKGFLSRMGAIMDKATNGWAPDMKHLSMLALIIVTRTALSDRIANLNGTTVEYVLQQDVKAFARLIGVSVLQSLASAITAPSLKHMTDLLALKWRDRLTVAASKLYLQRTAYYSTSQLADISDVDQRITRDIERLCNDLASLVPSLIKPIVDIAWFSWRMKRLTGGKGMFLLWSYMTLGFGTLKLLTPNFGKLASRQHQLEGEYRFTHSRLRSHAESVAFFGGGDREGRTISGRFELLLQHLKHIMKCRWGYGIADDFLTKNLPHNVQWIVSLIYAAEHKGDRGLTAVQGELARDMRYLASVVSQSFNAFGDLLSLYKRIDELKGGVNRVSEMFETLEIIRAMEDERDEMLKNSVGKPDEIVFEDAQITTPNGKLLAEKMSFVQHAGVNLLVTGPNGSGKSAIFRVLGGLWPLGGGYIRRPRDDAGLLLSDMFYVPQKPYNSIGTFREQLVYPMTVSNACQKLTGGTSKVDQEALDARLLELLDVVRLRYLLDREGGWDAVTEWEERLSLGEQQRIGMARLFFHKPTFGILDECTNATSVDIEEELYKYSTVLGITLVTISQRPALVPYHGMELRLLDGEGKWELREILKPQAIGSQDSLASARYEAGSVDSDTDYSN